MKPLDTGVYELESGDSIEKLGETIQTLTHQERERLSAENPQYEWWAAAVFYLHDMIAFTGAMRHAGLEPLADTVIEATTLTGRAFLELLLKGYTNRAELMSELWMKLLADAETLNATLENAVRKDEGVKDQ